MKTLKLLAIICLALLTILNAILLAKTQTTIKIKGTGNAFHKIDKETGDETWGCDRTNENECSMTIIDTSED